MRRAVLLSCATYALLLAVAPALSQSQQPRPLPPPGAPQQSKPLAPGPATQPQQQQQQQQQQAAQPPQAAPKPYQPVTITAPQPVKDPSFDVFRNQIADLAKRKDRAGLTKLVVAKDFFWLGEKGDRADKKRAGIDNLTRALDLNAKDGSGWEALAGYAADPTGMALPDRKDTICAPADPMFDMKQLENLAKETGTEPSEWGYPAQPGHRVAQRRANQRAGRREARHAFRPCDGSGRTGASARPATDAAGGRAFRQGRLRAG